MLTQDLLREWLNYDPETGVFTWKVKPNRNIRLGEVAGTTRSDGRIRLHVGGEPILAHRAAWLFVYGWLPPEIDHADCNPSNNRIDNLREATGSQNKANTKIRRTNSSGYKGVYWCVFTQKWAAEIHRNYRKFHLGRFDDIEDAAAAYASAAHRKFGEFARTA